MHRGDLAGIGRYRSTGPRPHHDRCNQIAGPGRIIVEQAQHVAGPEFKAEFFVKFAQRRFRLCLAIVAASAGQRPLATMGAQSRRAPRQQQRGFALPDVGLDQRGRVGHGYNVGADCERSNIAVVRAICALMDELAPDSIGPHERLITFVADRPGHDLRYAMDARKIRQELIDPAASAHGGRI